MQSIPKTIDIEKWVNQYSDVLYQQAYFKTSDKELSEDLVQETFLGALQNIPSTIRNEKAWLLSILRRKIADYYRTAEKKKRIETNQYSEEALNRNQYFDKRGAWKAIERPTAWNDTNNLSANKEFCAILKACVQKLPQHYQEAVRLKVVHNEKTSSICEDLDLSASNFWQIMHRTKLRLRKCLNKHWFQL